MESISEIMRWNNVAVRAAQDEAAFEELYNHFFPRVYKYLLGKVADTDAADEIVSRTFWKMYEHLSEYDMSKAAFSTWLFKIAINEMNQFWRESNRRTTNENEWDEDFDPVAPDFDEPEKTFIRGEVEERIRDALAKLPERERQIIVMTYWLNYPPRKIAEELGLTANHVSVILKRTKGVLKEYLADLAD